MGYFAQHAMDVLDGEHTVFETLTSAFPLAALTNRVLELTPEGVHPYGGGYTEYVSRTGRETPGLRS